LLAQLTEPIELSRIRAVNTATHKKQFIRSTSSGLSAINKRLAFFGCVLLVVSCWLWVVPVAQADCMPIFGGGQTCTNTGDVTITKAVKNPITNQFSHDLGTDVPFNPQDTVQFEITVTNTSGSTIDRIIVQDMLPPLVTFVSGQGQFDPQKKIVSLEVDKLASNHSKKIAITGNIVPTEQIPFAGGSTGCVSNKAIAITPNGKMTSDSSQFCVQKPVSSPLQNPPKNLKNTPPTGASEVGELFLLIALVVGYYLIKTTKLLNF